jgi:predicted ribosomally synthesized peptide with nif11-like leader
MSDFQSFRNAVLEDEDLQEQVISIVNTATANGAGLEENIVTLAKNHGFTVTKDDVTQHADFLGQDGDLTDFELEMISGGGRGGAGNCSDIRLKKDIKPLKSALSTLGKLQGKSYRWKDNNEPDIGLIAQELEKVIPELVKTDNKGYKSIVYQKLTAVLIEAVKEQQQEINNLSNRIAMLEGLPKAANY